MRAANRLLGLWERLQIRKEGIGVLVNRLSRDSEIQQDLVGRIVNATMLKTTLPADFRALESPANTGVPSRLEDGRFRQGLARLASELRVNVAEPAEQPRGGQRRSRRRDRARAAARDEAGQAAIETAALIGGLLFVVLVVFQLLLAGATMILASHAARQAASELALATPNEANLDQRLEDAAREDLFGGWNRDEAVEVQHGYDDVTVTLTVPPLLPARLLSSWRLSTTAGTIRERAPVDPPSGP
jgi:pilus assembly protein CpaE